MPAGLDASSGPRLHTDHDRLRSRGLVESAVWNRVAITPGSQWAALQNHSPALAGIIGTAGARCLQQRKAAAVYEIASATTSGHGFRACGGSVMAHHETTLVRARQTKHSWNAQIPRAHAFVLAVARRLADRRSRLRPNAGVGDWSPGMPALDDESAPRPTTRSRLLSPAHASACPAAARPTAARPLRASAEG